MSNYTYVYSTSNLNWLQFFFKKAFAVGAMPESKRCQQCGRTGRIEKHRPNYNHPLSIVFLCKRCHMWEHRPWCIARKPKGPYVKIDRLSWDNTDSGQYSDSLKFDSDDFVAEQREESVECLCRRLEGTRKLSGAIRTFRF